MGTMADPEELLDALHALGAIRAPTAQERERMAHEARTRELWRLETAQHLAGVVELQLLMAGGTAADAVEEQTPPTATPILLALATIRQLEIDSVDDAMDLFDLLMATKLLARAERQSDKAKLRSLPALRRAATKVGRALGVMLEIPENTRETVSLAQAWARIERTVSRGELTVALEELEKLIPDQDDGDSYAEWRAELIKRYGTVTGFLGLLARLELGAVGARTPVLAALRSLPALVHRKKVFSNELDATLITGSWRRLVFANPELPAGVADHRAYTFCVLEQLHRGLRHREIYAYRGDRWGDPRARLLDGERWESAKPRVLKALDLPAEPEAHLQALAVTLDDAYRQVASDIAAANGKAVVEDGKIRLDRLGRRPIHLILRTSGSSCGR